MDASEQLQQHLNLMRGEPIVRLHGIKAVKQAYKLRMLGVSYSSVAVLMGLYHGEHYTREYWRKHCSDLGAPGHPRGRKGAEKAAGRER